MKSAILAGFFALCTPFPAISGPVSDAHFVTGLGICINFGSDGWFVQSRIEDEGWTARFDAVYGETAFDSPDHTVVLIAPPEGGDFPLWCTVVSSDVALGFAQNAVRATLIGAQIDAFEGAFEGCPVFEAANGMEIRVLNDGNDDLCGQVTSAKVDVVTRTNPVEGQ